MQNNNFPTIHLKFPPAIVLFKPLNSGNTSLHYMLPKGILPIFPTQNKFHLGENNKCTVTQRQLALTPAYAFTDFKSQGQTMECVIVDIGKPPTGTLNAFNAYVTLSRS